ncbi:MAG: class I tRNA ligase family protein [Bacilli bacterium]|nr:class I tRNA ligase family protein [Bacilli bacterium]
MHVFYILNSFDLGVVKITPAHDPNDFEVGNRHNLERVVVMNKDATMNENAGKYCGMTREKCREELLKDLEKDGLLLSIEKMVHAVGHSERTGVMVEPYLSKQWFVKMRPLADKVLENQKDKDKKVNFVPRRYEKTMNHWMEITYDWCISRQLWWGHRIPAWYKGDEVYVGMEEPKGEGWVQDDDVLDTWFSSALWPFSTLGWPEKTDLMEKYFPNDCLVTGYDIIPFWVNRMTFQSLKLNGVRPFKDCIIHGLIRDKEGRKFSKSLGNGIDPFDMVEKYGADSLRYYLTTDVALGTDLRFDEVKMASTWNYINKIWNASRFVLMNIETLKEVRFDNLKIEDKWILTKYNNVLKSTIRHMDKYEFNLVAAETYEFVWNDFCSSYIELSKNSLDDETTKSVLYTVLLGILKMLHPFMPFVTEEIFKMLPIKESESIMISSYPKYDKKLVFDDEMKTLDEVLNDIVSIRNLKAVNKITKEAKVKFETIKELHDIYSSQLKIKGENLFSDNSDNMVTLNYKSKYIDITYYYEKEEEDNSKTLEDIKKLEESIERRKKLLSNENYVNKAPANIVEMDRNKLKEEEEKLEQLKKLI